MTNLPPGLLDSPPQHDTSPTPTDIHQLCASFIATPSTPVLTAPPNPTQHATSVTNVANNALGLTMRHSKRIAAQPPSNAKPADRARDTKMKKLGLSIANADSKAEKKMQLLKKLGGNVLKHADEVLSQLLTGPEKVA
jgi:hypothetical protein